MESNEVYTIKEAQKILKTSRQTLDVWRKKGILKAVKIGGKVFIKKDEIKKLLNEEN